MIVMELKMLINLILVSALCSISVIAKDCKQVDFGKGSIVCECNSTYCDYYIDPHPPKKGEFIWYITTKSGKRLNQSNGKISKKSDKGSKIYIDSNKSYQIIEGFGGAFTDSAGINIKKLSKGSQENILRSYFSVNGSKYNFGRVPIGGTDFSNRSYTYDDFTDDINLKNFKLPIEDIKYKIPIMKKALEINPSLRFVSAAWTAPPWMKNRHEYTGYSYLLEKYYQIYADYTIKFLDTYKKNGLEIWAVSTGNEPMTSLIPTAKINSMFWSVRTVSKWVIENLAPTLQKSNSNKTSILILDDQRINLPWYLLNIKFSYNKLLQYIKGIAIHWYTDSFSVPSILDLTHQIAPDKFILMTEACVGERPWDYPKVILGSWSRAERLIKKLFQNMNHWVVGWIDWNLALNIQGGPNWVENYVDAPIIVVPENDIFYKQPLYYILTHFSKFIPRYSVKIDATSADNNILVTAFKFENQIIVLLYNSNNRMKHVSIIDKKVGSINVELEEYSLHTILYKEI